MNEASKQRISAQAAEYMELAGAVKDADCEKVDVKGGVSSQLGCCDKFFPENKKTSQFRCGTCEYVLREHPLKKLAGR